MLPPAQDHHDVRTNSLQLRHKLRCRIDIPDIDADTDDQRLLGQDGLDGIDWPLVDVEFQNGGARLERPEIGHEIAQPERRVCITRVERCQDDVRHDGKVYQNRPAPP